MTFFACFFTTFLTLFENNLVALQYQLVPRVSNLTLCITLYYIYIIKQTQKPKAMKTYDVHFNNNENSNNKGFSLTIEECRNYINSNNGTNLSYFPEYRGGTVSIVCNETGETVYETEVL